MHIDGTLVPESPPLDGVLNAPLQRAFAHEWVVRLPLKAGVAGQQSAYLDEENNMRN